MNQTMQLIVPRVWYEAENTVYKGAERNHLFQ